MSIHSPPESPTLRRLRGGGGGGARARGPPAPAAAAPPVAGAPPDTSSTLDCCVRLLVVHCEPSFSLPWSKKRQFQSSSSGFVIEGRRLLTNAHCVQDATAIKVQRRDSPDRYLAEVLAVSTDADLALLTVRDAAFWRGAPAVTFADGVPALQERALVAGFPVGGAGLSLSSGVVSRVEVLPYAHSGVELVALQSDAPINSGNSGGPAFDPQGKCIGAAFQSLRADEADGVGYIIPVPIVRRFLADVECHGKYTGFAALGVEWQKIESRALRRALRLPETPASSSQGVLVRRVHPTAPAAGVLRRGDVILALDGIDVASDGTVPFRPGERVAFSYLISQRFCGDEIEIKVLRAPEGALGEEDGGGGGDGGGSVVGEDVVVGNDGGGGGGGGGNSSSRRAAGATAAGAARGKGNDKAEEEATSAAAAGAARPAPLPLPARQPETLRVRLARPERLVPYHLEPGQSPSYFVVGGLAFTPLTAGYLRSEFGRDYESEAPVSLVAALTHGVARKPGEQVVLLAQVLAHAANVGYEDVCAAPVRSVNGRRVSSMRALVRETEAALARGDPFLQYVLAQDEVVVLSSGEAQRATPEVLEAHAIAHDRSADLMDDDGGGRREANDKGGKKKKATTKTTKKKEDAEEEEKGEASGGGKRARRK